MENPTATKPSMLPVVEMATRLMEKNLGSGLWDAQVREPDVLWFRIDRQMLRTATVVLLKELKARFLISAGTDLRAQEKGYGILHLFSLDREGVFLALDCLVPEWEERIDSITPLIPGADWSERECRDAVGVEARGHPDPRRLILPDDWPEGAFPLRRDFPYNERPPAAEGVRPAPKEHPEGTTVIPIGPFFPSLEEPSNWRIFLEGETVKGCDYRGFYNHRGIEKLGDSVLTWDRIPYVAERICGICGFIHSTCYCQAAEKAAGLQPPRRAEFIRTLMLELERIHSHLLWLGIAGHIVGFDTVLMQTWRIREPVMWLSEEISGNRKTYGMNAVGGVRRDIRPEQMPKIQDVVRKVEEEVLALKKAIVGDTTLLARTRGVGILTEQWAKEICVVGPPARASGVPIDARLDHPYAAYDAVPPTLCTQEEGDTWARVLVRVDEVVDATRIIRECLDQMPAGPVMSVMEGEFPDGRVGVSVVEAPRGEAIHFVMTGGLNRPYRWRVRAPTYPNLQAMPAMIQDQQLADVPIILGSLDPCFSCTERMEAVDRRTGARRVYSWEELETMARRAAEERGAPS
jgi:Ni,Fe-hydrogenase III large subunit/Ni,Fe-hydrogenase III component G